MLIHGDAHPANVLEDPNDPNTYKLIDPDGMRSEPAHDLAIPLRDWTDELLAGDAVALGHAWCRRLANRAGVDPRPIWEWAFVERVSTGLFLLRLGDPLGARLPRRRRSVDRRGEPLNRRPAGATNVQTVGV